MMDWPQLLSLRRLGQPAPDPSDRPRTPFQVDHDRIIFSSAFRRLQDKTQVFPLAESDFVRTRLTHSLEVSCVGRSLGSRVGETICKRHDLGHLHESDFGAIVAAASLAHDLGNPPFGHSGEDAMRHWFLHSPVAKAMHGAFTPAQHADFARYEGNAHAFRVVAALQMPENDGGMQLTCATLGALAKYPIESHVPDAAKLHRGCSGKKFNFFQAEKSLFAQVAEITGLIPRTDQAAWWCRHPLAFLVEAADDICYRTIDFEDAFRHDLISFDEIRTRFLSLIGPGSSATRVGEFKEKTQAVQFLRAKAIGRLIDQATTAFLEREEAILAGEFDQPLIDVIPASAELREIDLRSQESIYSNRHVIGIEVAGFEVIGKLLDTFAEAANDTAGNKRSRKRLQLLAEQFVGPGHVVSEDPYIRLLRLMDFVAGMTDTYAVALFQRVHGIQLG